jgi:hypothetical protein
MRLEKYENKNGDSEITLLTYVRTPIDGFMLVPDLNSLSC